jgi:hypothetical protein
MAAIKSLDASTSKWQRRSAAAGPDYTSGVQNPRTPWATAAANADTNYRAGVTAAASAGRYAAGVRKAGDAKWSSNAVAKGPTRYAEGVQLAGQNWSQGFQPYQTAISGITLPARGPVGAAQNLQRVTAIATALRAVKTRTSGGTTP